MCCKRAVFWFEITAQKMFKRKYQTFPFKLNIIFLLIVQQTEKKAKLRCHSRLGQLLMSIFHSFVTFTRLNN